MTIVRGWSCLVRQLTMAVQQLHDGEDEEPKTEHRGKDAQDKDGGAAVVQMTLPGSKRVEIGIGDPAKSNPWAEGGHEYQCDADDDADVEHSELPSRLQKTPRASSELDATGRYATVN